MHFLGNLLRVLLDCPHIFFGNVNGRDNTCGVTGVYPCKLDMLHDRRDEGVVPVADSVGFTFQSVVQETVNQNRAVRRHADSGFHVAFHALVVINLHAPSAQHIGGAHHNGIADISCDCEGFVYGSRHARFGHRDIELVHHCPEKVPVFR